MKRIKNRNILLEVFNDAQVVAPIILTAITHSRANPGHTFLYKFDHVTENGYHDKVGTIINTCLYCAEMKRGFI